MAIWQFSLIIIPRKGVIEKFGYIPDKFNSFVDNDGFKKYVIPTHENGVEMDFSDCDWWHSTDIEPMEIISQVDKYVKRRKYYDEPDELYVSWKTHVRYVIDNDADLVFNKQTGKVLEWSFRADLRDESLTFLKQMVELSKLYDCLLLDRKGNIIEPNMNAVANALKISNSFRFLQNPEQFFTDLQDGNLKIE
jgi:hypothetical protein